MHFQNLLKNCAQLLPSPPEVLVSVGMYDAVNILLEVSSKLCPHHSLALCPESKDRNAVVVPWLMTSPSVCNAYAGPAVDGLRKKLLSALSNFQRLYNKAASGLFIRYEVS